VEYGPLLRRWGRLGVGSASPALVKGGEGHASDPRLEAPCLSPAFSLAVVELWRLRRREPRQLLSTEISTAACPRLRGERLSGLDGNAVEAR